jgi:F-box-like
MPHLLDLPTELLIQIFSNLHISDFGACLLTCHRLKDIIQDSHLIQYLIRTALAGVYDPFLPSGPPLQGRLESLERWLTAWQQFDIFLRDPSRVLVTRTRLHMDFLLHDDYLIVLDLGARRGHQLSTGYEWVDLRKLDSDWVDIRFEQNWVPLTFALDVAQHNLMAGLFW